MPWVKVEQTSPPRWAQVRASDLVREWRCRSFLRSCIPHSFYESLITRIAWDLHAERLRGRDDAR